MSLYTHYYHLVYLFISITIIIIVIMIVVILVQVHAISFHVSSSLFKAHDSSIQFISFDHMIQDSSKGGAVEAGCCDLHDILGCFII